MVSTVADILPRLLPEVPGCPDNYATLVLRDAVRDTLRFTEVWTKELTAINLVASTATYNLNPAVTAVAATEPEILRIVSAKVSGTEVNPAGYKLVGITGSPYFALTFNTGYIPTAAVTSGLVVTVALAPNATSESTPVFELNKIYEAVIALASSRLLAETGKKYSNPSMHVIRRRQYWRAVNDLIYQRLTGRVAASPQASGVPFL